jgi:hypothetical protein
MAAGSPFSLWSAFTRFVQATSKPSAGNRANRRIRDPIHRGGKGGYHSTTLQHGELLLVW